MVVASFYFLINFVIVVIITAIIPIRNVIKLLAFHSNAYRDRSHRWQSAEVNENGKNVGP